jgi:chorismate mutase/prephenate dehydratase
MEAAKLVAEYKKERGLPVLDQNREDALIAQNSELIENPELREYYVNFLRHTMKLSRDYQQRLISGIRVAYGGVPGAFASEAAELLYPEGEHVSCADFIAAYHAVEAGDCDVCVLPIENSFAGEVGQVMDLVFSGSLYLNRTVDLAVQQNLLVLPGTNLEDVREVISHPQALAQCEGYLNEHDINIRTPYSNTALAVKFVSELGKPHVAAIGSVQAARLYGLEVLERGINQSAGNTTRFACFTRAENQGSGRPDDSFMLMFTVKHQAGALAQAINIIGAYGYNMRSLHSRPMKDLAWNYYFYVECEGDVRNENGKQMLRALRPMCDKLKLVGSYSIK